MMALDEMGQKGKRAMTPLDPDTANALRVRLGKGRELPAEAKPKRTRPKTLVAGAPSPAETGTVGLGNRAPAQPPDPEAARRRLRPPARTLEPRPPAGTPQP